MSGNASSFLQFVAITGVISTVAHAVSRRLAVATATSAVLSAGLTILLWTYRQGHFDGWFLVAFFTMCGLGVAISLAVGLMVGSARTRRERRRHAS